MKDHRQERLGRLQREYHRNHPWRLGPGGLFVPHSYAEVKQDALSWWDDVGFILNRRRVIVWWRHPRHVYRDAIEELAQEQAGEFPFDDWLTQGAIPNYRKVGRSRKKIVSYTCRPPSEASRAYFQHLQAMEQELSAQGIDCDVHPSSKRKRLSWATGLDLVAPLEVRNEQELAVVADLACRLLLGSTTLEREFSDYCYNKATWLSEAAARM
ncbi:hypothetical protein GCM10022279_17970 [Comamonas faecalis]|uniref:Uncharacterized protein n=1 Tax=Comamonas faecalis TaxID=1387849 RepID=A0ABP7RAY0_9BURK